MTSPPVSAANPEPVSHRPKSNSLSSSHSSDYSPRKMATSIPIPSSNSFTSTRQHSPSSSRSPTSSSLSSYRSHPYPRRPSQPQPSSENLPRIHLPPPNSAAPLNVNINGSPRDREGYPSISSLALNSPSGNWRGDGNVSREREREYDIDREREWERDRDRERERERDRSQPLHRSSSGTGLPSRISNHPDRTLHLPPFQSFSSASSSSPSQAYTPITTPPALTSMPPPPLGNSSGNGSSTPASPKVFGMSGLRPSYSYDVTTNSTVSGTNQRLSPGGGSTPRLGSWRDENYHASGGYPSTTRANVVNGSQTETNSVTTTSPLQSRHYQQHVPDFPSPPLRSIGATTYSPDKYMHHPNSGSIGRSRSHSAASVISRGNEMDGGMLPNPPREGAGQSRRLAHLMSEQKRRESINTGFQNLRLALPNSIATDSKAIILRKAVTHITLLESLLRKAGINITSSKTSSPSTSNWAEEDVNMEMEDDGDEGSPNEKEKDNDREQRRLVGLGVLKVEKNGWEDVQVENIQVVCERERGG